MNRILPGAAKDLQAVLLLTILTLFSVFIPSLNSSSLRVVFGLPFVLFLPGYALIAALFPRNDDLDGIERVALSFGLSIAVVPLIGLVLNYTPFGIRLVPIALSLSSFIIVLSAVAQIRRNSLGVGESFDVRFDYKEVIKLEFESRLDKFLTILLIISILAAIVALVYVIASPKRGERFTEFYILGSNGMAADYPTDLDFGEPTSVRVGIVNQEYESLNYALVVVLENTTLYRGSIRLAHNATWEEAVPILPFKSGNNLKLEFLLYKNSSAEPYRSLHLWVDVS